MHFLHLGWTLGNQHQVMEEAVTVNSIVKLFIAANESQLRAADSRIQQLSRDKFFLFSRR